MPILSLNGRKGAYGNRTSRGALKITVALPAVPACATARPTAPPEFVAIAIKSAAAAKFPRLLLAGLIDCQRASIKNFPIQLIDNRFHIGIRGEFHKCETSGTPGFGVTHHSDAFNRDVQAGKKLAEPCVRHVKRQISYKKLVRHMASTDSKSIEKKKGDPANPESPKRLKLN
jgi:hypothetical protein